MSYSYLIFGVHVRTILEEHLERLHVAALRGPQQSRPLALVPGLDVDLGLVEQVLDYLGLVVIGRLHQRGLLPAVLDLYLGLLVHEEPHDVVAPHGAGQGEGREVVLVVVAGPVAHHPLLQEQLDDLQRLPLDGKEQRREPLAVLPVVVKTKLLGNFLLINLTKINDQFRAIVQT